MKIYLTVIDERVWQCILMRYTPPTKTDENKVKSPKPIKEWFDDEHNASGSIQKDLILLSTELICFNIK